MKQTFLEAGRIVGTHGIRGEVRVQPWCDSPAFLLDFATWYMDGQAVRVQEARVHKHLVLAKLEGIDTMNEAQALRNRIMSVRRADAKLPEGRFFIQDILGLPVVDDVTGAPVGTLTDVWQQPGQDVYVVKDEQGTEHLIPNVPAFIRPIEPDAGCVRVTLIEGM